MMAIRRLDGWTVSPNASRREFLRFSVGAVLAVYPSTRLASAQDSLAGSGPAGKLWDPRRAGRPLTASTAADNDLALQAIEKRLHCTCGCNLDVYTCRTTDFTCTTSPAMHLEVVGMAERGMSGEQILDDFVARHGQVILMAPPKRGFNLAGYFVPSVAIAIAGLLLTIVLRRRLSAAAVARPAPVPAGQMAGGTAAELARLQDELDHFTA
jgi:cytochrome c-type biogenesis protein CcmH/NrfF